MTVESVTESTQSSQRDDESVVSFINTESRLNDAAPQSAADTVAEEQSMDFVVAGGEYGKDYEYTPNTDTAQSGVLTLHPSTESVTLTVSMAGSLRHQSTADSTATKDRIVVTPVAGVPANVVLKNVKINLSKDTNIDAAAFAHMSGKLNLTLASKSESKLISGSNHAGLEKNDIDGKPSEAFALTITSEGSSKADWGTLIAQSNTNGAGIGGGKDSGSSYITVAGGVITAQSYGGAYSSSQGAGIGGGSYGAGSYITIVGGVVNAQSYAGRYAFGAGIGGGAYGVGSHIAVDGGVVTAQSSASTYDAWGAGIGGGEQRAGSDIRITGGHISASGYSAIGSGYFAADASVSITGGYFADASADALPKNTVYGVAPADDCDVIANDGNDKDTYPIRVVSVSPVDFVVAGGEAGEERRLSCRGTVRRRCVIDGCAGDSSAVCGYDAHGNAARQIA
ncbi:hypothetical protein EHS19_07895 [Bifidobacterium jacchi]|uniref:GLUG domain-containing protein n=2 Tax=Bifidobacterium jacchi TaxID=2490545 RepID=A0A5N5RG99_9BIFI|nr:hypothetical protein EHS19_07895 [Bifidobacterium jacchi]